MFRYYNAHPQGKEVRDCVKRSISLVAEMDYHQVQIELNRYKKVTGAKAYNTDHNPHKYCENVLMMEKLSFPAETGKSRMDGFRFEEEFPKGRYILNMAGHWTACVDGDIYDIWDCREKCVYTAYRMRSADEIANLKALQEQEEQRKAEAKKQQEILKAKTKKIKEKYAKRIKPLEKKIKELQKAMAKEIEELKNE